MAERAGYRGYVASRPFAGGRAPQHVQNLVIRDYCARNDLPFRMSAVEYAMPGCHMVLAGLLDTVPRGIVFYSLFLLPERRDKRQATYQRLLDAGISFHAAVEDLSFDDAGGIPRIEDIWRVAETEAHAPQLHEIRNAFTEGWETVSYG